MFDRYDDEDDNEHENNETTKPRTPRKFLGIMFDCCHVYSRIYQNKQGTAYVGRCPKCMRIIKIPIGQSGDATNRRFFRAE